MLLEADPAAAARQASRILAGAPGHAEANLLLAAACRRLGDAASAAQVLESLTQAHPDSAVLQLELGRSYAAGGRVREAIAALRRALENDAALADAWRELAAQCFLAGDLGEGDRAYQKYTELAPEPPELIDVRAALVDNRLDPADALLRRHLGKAPRDAAALYLIANVADKRKERTEAERWLKACLEAAPGHAQARHDLARLLYAQERIAEALPHIDRLIAAQPGNSDYLSLKALTIRQIGRIPEALALMEAVLTAAPHDASMWLIYGNLLREVGEQARAIEAYRRALAEQADFGEGYSALANLQTFRFDAADIEAMERQLAAKGTSAWNRTHLEFALGKAYEDLAEFETSFAHYARGNALHRATIEFDGSVPTAFVQRSRVVCTPQFFEARAQWGNERPDPIFIVGLPRSGSTLLEQILATHSQVEGTRELPDLPDMVMEMGARMKAASDAEYPTLVAALGRAEIEAMAARYLTQTATRRRLGLPRFVDKLLGNFSQVALIHLMFPRAAIIDARRHPLACGFSCYKQLFVRGLRFSFDLAEFGRYYRDYAELMEHIDAVLPNRVHRVFYEHLVDDPEREVRRLLDYCRLPFEADCLRFYQNPRVVQTMSSEQVRRPIYRHAVEQWRHYEPWLKPLRDALGDLVERYPVPAPLASA